MLSSPVGEAGRFPSRIEKEEAWSTHPSLKDRVKHAEQYRIKDEKQNFEPAYEILDMAIINIAGERFQRNIAFDEGNDIKWHELTPFDEKQMSEWIDQCWDARVLPYFMNPFTQTRILPFQLPHSDDAVENDAIDYPFTQENRDFILEYRQAFTDWQTLQEINPKEATAKGFFYCGKQYHDKSTPVTIHKNYIGRLYNKKQMLDKRIYLYLLEHAEDKGKITMMYWMIFFSQTQMDNFEPVESKAAEISNGFAYIKNNGGNVYGVSVNDQVKQWLYTSVREFLANFDYDDVDRFFGEWKVDDETTVSKELADWKKFLKVSENYEYSDQYVLGIIHSIWTLLQEIFTVADNDWQTLVMKIYNQHKKQI
jgi:hypothetical protein